MELDYNQDLYLKRKNWHSYFLMTLVVVMVIYTTFQFSYISMVEMMMNY